MLFTRSFPLMMRPAYWWDTRAALFYGLYNGLTLSYLAVVAVRLNMPAAVIGFVAAAPYLGYLGTSWFAAHPLDRRCIPACTRAWFLGRTLTGVMLLTAGRPWLFLAVSLLLWAGEAWGMPGYSVIVQRVYPVAERGRAMGNVRVFSTLSLVLGAALGGVLLDRLGTGSYLLLFPAGGLAGVIAAHYFTRIRVPHDGGRLRPMPVLRSWRYLRRRPALMRFTAVQFISGAGNLVAVALFPLFQVRELGLSNFAIGMLIALTGLCNALSFSFWGRMIDRHGPLVVLKRILLLVPLVPLGYACAFSIGPVIAASVVAGLTLLAWDLAWQNYLFVSVGRQLQGVIGLQYTLLGIRGLVFPILGVWLAGHFGMRPVLLVAALLIAIGALALPSHSQPADL
ncbi:MAG TPA: MFS transporter [bacterium]|nr:MFS transporter [bacterium]